MSGPDVRELAGEALPEASFPSDGRSDFRLHMLPEVHQGTWEHAKQDTSIEICGVLVGRWEQDANGPYAVVTNFIRGESAASKFAEVTFTHESWSQINAEMDSKYADARIVGWYHSHPDFGIFLSDRDCFIHEHFFSNPGQVAYVIDPVRNIEGMFAWRAGKPEPLDHYWIGDRIETGAAHARPSPATSLPATAADVALLGTAAPRSWLQDLVMLLLLGLVCFVFGYFMAGQKSNWERRMIEQGAVAHYGINKMMKIGLEEDLAALHQQLDEVCESLTQLPEVGVKLEADDLQAATALRSDIQDNLDSCRDGVRRIEMLYGLTPVERETLLWIVARKQAELQQAMQAAREAMSAPKKDTDQPASEPASEKDKNKVQQPSPASPSAIVPDQQPDKVAPAGEAALPPTSE